MGCSQSGKAVVGRESPEHEPRLSSLSRLVRMSSLRQTDDEIDLPWDDDLEPDAAEDPLRRTHRGLGPFGAPLPPAAPWDSGRFRFVRKLEDAERNHGWVDAFADLKRGGVQCAVKRIPKDWATAGPRAFARIHLAATERPWTDIAVVQHLNSLDCAFACELLGLFVDHDFTYVVSSLASDGDLFTWSSSCPLRGQAREFAVQPFVVQLFAAVQHLHDLGIAHRDICLENVLLHQDTSSTMRSWSAMSLSSFGPLGDNSPMKRSLSAKSFASLTGRDSSSTLRPRSGKSLTGRGDTSPMRASVQPPLKVKLIDFGMATASRHCCAGEVRGKPQFQSPEMHIASEGYDSFAADVFALGVLLFAVVFEAYPWNSTLDGVCKDFAAAAEKGIASWFETVPMPRRKSVKLASIVSEGCQDLIVGMLQLDLKFRSNLGEECWSDADACLLSVWHSDWLNAQPTSRRLQVTGSTRSMNSLRSCGSLCDLSQSAATTGDADSSPSEEDSGIASI